MDNHVILVGKGPHINFEVPGRQGESIHIYGAEMDLGYVAGYVSTVPGNTATLDIYGTGVNASDIQNFTTLNFHRLDDLVESIGIGPCKLCTYCFNGKE